MKIKKINRSLVAFMLLICFSILAFSGTSISAYAQELVSDSIYQDVAINFFEAQYEERDIVYEDAKVVLESDLYSSTEEIVAKAIVIERDGQYDYVILNIATAEIDEFGFNEATAYDKFSQKVYYTGALNYYVQTGDTYLHFDGKTKMSKDELKNRSKGIEQKYQETRKNAKRFTTDGNPLPVTSKTGWNGFYDWSTISTFNSNNGYTNSDWDYLTGINWNGVTGSGLSFMDQNTFNSHFGTNNACGPTALTNMFIWFEYMGIENEDGVVNALRNDSAFDTFARFRTLVNHSNTDGTSRSAYNGALKDYAKEQGYDYEIDTGVDTFDEFKTNIANDMPVLASIDLDGWGGHAVLVVGYEEFEQSYEEDHGFLWWDWTTTEYRYCRYLRVIDGWGTSNSSRFIDCGGYWDTLTGRGFKIK